MSVAEKPHPAHSSSLKREVGLIGLMWASVGSIIGSGWLFGAQEGLIAAGPAAMISWVVGGLMMMVLALIHAELGGMYPVSGGTARFPHYAFGGAAERLLDLVRRALGQQFFRSGEHPRVVGGEQAHRPVRPDHEPVRAERLQRDLDVGPQVRDRPPVAVGLGVPATIDHDTGVAVSAVNLPLSDLPIRDLVR